MESEQQVAYPGNSAIFPDAGSALHFFLNETEGGHNVFRISETQIPFSTAYVLHDVKTMDRYSEERLLIKHPTYVYNMRRGTSFLAPKDSLGKIKAGEAKSQVHFARRGMVKFFDLLPEYLCEEYKVPSFDNRANHMLFPLQESYKKGNAIEIFSMRKANGESAQISYCNILDAWIVGSKNVSICIRSREDIKLYEQYSRVYYKIGLQWDRKTSIRLLGK